MQSQWRVFCYYSYHRWQCFAVWHHEKLIPWNGWIAISWSEIEFKFKLLKKTIFNKKMLIMFDLQLELQFCTGISIWTSSLLSHFVGHRAMIQLWSSPRFYSQESHQNVLYAVCHVQRHLDLKRFETMTNLFFVWTLKIKPINALITISTQI